MANPDLTITVKKPDGAGGVDSLVFDGYDGESAFHPFLPGQFIEATVSTTDAISGQIDFVKHDLFKGAAGNTHEVQVWVGGTQNPGA